MKQVRVAIVVSHPIQHFCPQYASVSDDPGISLKVFFASALGYKKYHDPNFGQSLIWSNLRLDQFQHEFLNDGKVLPADRKLDAAELGTALDAFAPELIVIYGYFQKLQRRAVKWARSRSVPVAYISDSELRHHENPFKVAIKAFWIKRFFGRISYFLTVGDANEDYYRRLGVSNEKMHRMHFPIDIELYRDSYLKRVLLRDELRKKFAIPREEIVLSVVGKLVSWKSQGHLIQALKTLDGRSLKYHLFILGSGEDAEELKASAAELKFNKVYFPGFVSPEELPSYYASTDIYIHPAEIEPHSLAISEAIYMGCPVILSSRCGSYGETDDVQPGTNGEVFEYGNIQELASKIEKMAGDGSKREIFSRESHGIGERNQEVSHNEAIQRLSRNL